ncbi:MAG: zinc-ribbon protein [Acidobacteria bacterium]|nr:zinc-ribbon protein [Acidobacteriota bacterium]
MGDRPQGEGWWLASDGKWYPPESRPAPPAPPAPPWALAPQTQLSPGLHTAVRVFLYLSGATAGLAVVALANAIPRMHAYWFAPVGADAAEFSAWEEAADLWAVAAGLVGLAGLVLFILLLVWGNQAYRSLNRSGAEGRSWSSGWAVGGWFIPLAAVVIPRLVLSEIERISHPDNGPAPIGAGWRRQPLLGTGLAWWILLVCAGVLGAAGAAVTGTGTLVVGEGVDAVTTITDGVLYRNGLALMAAAMVLAGIAQLLGAAYFRSLGERLLR